MVTEDLRETQGPQSPEWAHGPLFVRWVVARNDLVESVYGLSDSRSFLGQPKDNSLPRVNFGATNQVSDKLQYPAAIDLD
jgi:hypothetical protein